MRRTSRSIWTRKTPKVVACLLLSFLVIGLGATYGMDKRQGPLRTYPSTNPTRGTPSHPRLEALEVMRRQRAQSVPSRATAGEAGVKTVEVGTGAKAERAVDPTAVPPPATPVPTPAPTAEVAMLETWVMTDGEREEQQNDLHRQEVETDAKAVDVEHEDFGNEANERFPRVGGPESRVEFHKNMAALDPVQGLVSGGEGVSEEAEARIKAEQQRLQQEDAQVAGGGGHRLSAEEVAEAEAKAQNEAENASARLRSEFAQDEEMRLQSLKEADQEIENNAVLDTEKWRPTLQKPQSQRRQG
eukprot:TRINITY_DN26048_c0_g2_i2.p2 TRINITY_DN26048_c0_g2~~TRINITY_DN26048_c0_g2_i2.p2  ORF type:complete len:301 (+),score=72.81 TRINITY_DN26048_c0_g2_i2:266-1168(+)